MVARSLKIRILFSFVAVVSVLVVLIALLGHNVIKHEIFDRAQKAVHRELKAARYFYADAIEDVGKILRWIDSNATDLETLRHKAGLDYLDVVSYSDLSTCPSEIVLAAATQMGSLGGTRIISADELRLLQVGDVHSRLVSIRSTPRARPTEKQQLKAVMAKEYAIPQRDASGAVTRILYGGRIINQDLAFVDRIRDLVFGADKYQDKPVGTVTIFQDDVRVATNVLDEEGQRAVGTRVSEEVYRTVVEQGQTWDDRAFVVTDWYKTAYEPIRNINGDIIGILYVGILEQPFTDMAQKILGMFLTIGVGVGVLAVILALIVSIKVSRPLTEIATAADKLAEGDLGYAVNGHTEVIELNTLAHSFNTMSRHLKEREESLKASNKQYVELIGFVAHELKGMLASAIMNTYSVRDGFLGMINFKQRKAIDSVARNLDYLTSIVRKFLSLGRIERGDLNINKVTVKLREEVYEVSLESLQAMIERKGLQIDNRMETNLEVQADLDLMQIVANNLISNAIKYSHKDGRVSITAESVDEYIRVEVYNDSVPISEEQKAKLFQKFSRLANEQTKREKGTGLGLFITKQIVEAHGGRIWVEPREQGNAFIFEIERG
ncbi:cache domain-containing protein [Planctomycetota bacterium]